MIERFVRLFDRTEDAFNFAFGARRYARPVLARRHMRFPFDTKRKHHVLEYAAFRNRAVVEVYHFGTSLKRKCRIGFRRHGVEQKAQRGFRVLAIHTVVFYVIHAATIIDHAEKHERRRALCRIDPRRRFDMLQIRRRHIELPTFVGVFSLEANGGRLARQTTLIQM